MIAKIRNLVASVLSLLVLVAGVLSVLVVLEVITVDQLWRNLGTLVEVGVIVMICSMTLIVLLRMNRKEK